MFHKTWTSLRLHGSSGGTYIQPAMQWAQIKLGTSRNAHYTDFSHLNLSPFKHKDLEIQTKCIQLVQRSGSSTFRYYVAKKYECAFLIMQLSRQYAVNCWMEKWNSTSIVFAIHCNSCDCCLGTATKLYTLSSKKKFSWTLWKVN